MSDFRIRLFAEYDELLARQQKLESFILSPAYDALPEIVSGLHVHNNLQLLQKSENSQKSNKLVL